MLRAMGLSLLLTELIELSAALLLKKREDMGLIALANLMTNPAVVYSGTSQCAFPSPSAIHNFAFFSAVNRR